MYNLLVSNQVTLEGPNVITLATERFLEYTSGSISGPLSSLSIEAMESLKSWPCLLMEEGRGQETAFLRRISSIDSDGGEVRVSSSPVPTLVEMTNDDLWKLRSQLDIGEFEFSRNHWAVKQRDLLPVLLSTGIIADNARAAFASKPIPGAARADLIQARMALGQLGHTDLDDFLLEIGVPDLRAGRDVGSKRDRAIKIITFAIDHPEAKTAENHLLSTVILNRTTSPVAFPAPSNAEVSANSFEPEGILGFSRAGIEMRSPNRVFIVHGRNDVARTKVMKLLMRVGLTGIVLHEQPNMGRHLLTKFIDEAELVTFAIVLLTDDDIGGVSDMVLQPRARQNVILELGYFLAHLGQQRVCAIKTPGLETPSDFDGIVYISMDNQGAWEQGLIRELRAAGMPLST
jgi:hypothetical protein